MFLSFKEHFYIASLSLPSELEEIVQAFVSSCTDYCNTLFTGLDKSCLSRLQAIQNAPASLMLASNLTLSFLFSLHWLQLILKFLLQFPNLHKDHRIKKLQTIYLNFLLNTLLLAVFTHKLKIY